MANRMANERGWSIGSEVFNSGQKVPPKAFDGVPLSIYNSLAKSEVEKDCAPIPIIYIALRVGTFIFCIVSFVILSTTHDDGLDYCDFGTEDYCWFSWKAINSSNMAYLLTINVFVCFYSTIQLVLLVKAACIGKSLLARPTSSSTTFTLICDKILTYILMAGCGAGACNVANSKKESTDSGMFSCSSDFSIFCNKEAASVAMSFVSFLSSAFISGLAYFRMHKVAKKVTSSHSNLLPTPTTIINTQQQQQL